MNSCSESNQRKWSFTPTSTPRRKPVPERHSKRCAEACRRCAEACGKMAA
ncbi:four-helix bundle copper-binding protein [Rhodoferax sp.]